MSKQLEADCKLIADEFASDLSEPSKEGKAAIQRTLITLVCDLHSLAESLKSIADSVKPKQELLNAPPPADARGTSKS